MLRSRLFVYWLCAFILAGFLVANSSFKSSNDDSKYYTQMVVRYQTESWKNVLTPKWGVNYYGFDPKSYMCDQFPGQLALGVLVSKIGVPADHSLHILEMLFFIIAINLMSKIGKHFIKSDESDLLLYGLLLTPLAFSYNLRANHESGIMLFSFLALYAGLKLPTSKLWGIVTIFSTIMLLLIKGPFFIFGLGLTVIGYFFSGKDYSFKKILLLILINCGVVVTISYLYEAFYISYTGVSFLGEFYQSQFVNRALLQSTKHSFVIQKLSNWYYYFSHYLIYALPWSLVAILVAIRCLLKKEIYFWKSSLSYCLLSASFLFCLVFTMSDRTATRYTFPAYYLFSAWCLLFIFYNSKKMQSIHASIINKGIHFIVPAIWLLAVLLHLVELPVFTR